VMYKGYCTKAAAAKAVDANDGEGVLGDSHRCCHDPYSVLPTMATIVSSVESSVVFHLLFVAINTVYT